ncbi:MAG: valine--tRNA ligase [Clostridia bacterium]|nr:valine--tRNA ligase [Clostridium sp.]
MNEKFNPKDFEDKLYKEWEEKGYFKPSMDKSRESYCIMMPPPNVTGKLHMGHALDDTIQDILIRFKRMQGYNTLWLPGSDHASISTEMKVVEKLKNEGKTKQELGREKFLEEAWEWTKLYGGTIQEQQKKLGCSCDWDRRRFTLDEGLSEAVLEQFVDLYNKGLIYKGTRMINYCPNCKTSISDAEVEYKEEASHLWHIRYKISGEEDRYIIVATTRPETMLGDTAVAVHPDDERYKDLVGKKCILPIMNKEIPIIADEFVEKEFGTGCVKITPAHDMNDYQAGIRHNLEIIEVFDENYKMGNLVPEYKGMDLLEARNKIVEKLKEIGALIKEEEYTHNVGKCERCKTTIEPKISEQWFVSMKDLAKKAADSVRNNEAKFIPQKYEKQYFNWLDNIQDWCISRQLWWGHQIPAYYCEECGHINVAKKAPKKCEKCGSTKLHQDEDTLDTWFSSALWPFSTLGWPNTETEDYKTFYPTNVLVTGFDIITFWVSRMMSQGIEFTGKAPFKDILIHGMVRDSQGRKMSKTLGNGIDPIEIIDKYGADSLRFAVISGTTMGNDIRYMPEKLEQASNFANKIWNATKFITNNEVKEEDIIKFHEEVYNKETKKYNSELLKIEDKWIISKLETLIEEVTNNLENYDLGVALDKVYNFIWNEFCDWYIEMVKPRLYSEDYNEKVKVCYVLDYIFGMSMKLLHPFMPFVTTEIYRNLVKYNDKDLMISKWPYAGHKDEFKDEENFVEMLKRIITEIRNTRAKMNVHPSKKADLIFVTEKYDSKIKEAKEFLLKLGFGNDIIIQENKTGIKEDAISILEDGIELYIPFEGLVDMEQERKRLEEEKKRLKSEVARCEKMLSNPGFMNKAPQNKIEEEQAKLKKYKEMLAKLEK